MSILNLVSVTLDYPKGQKNAGPKRVLEKIDLQISTGEFVVVIGRSGSGKTSLLNVAAGFARPTDGRVLIDGSEVLGPGANRAVVFQHDALYPWLSAADNVAFPLKLRGMAKAERRQQADMLLERVGLGGAGSRNIWELSGGMRQRVGIARALACAPNFLLLDEPLGALDALTRGRMQRFLLDVWADSGTGALLITHSIEEALLLATRVVVLAPDPGRMVGDLKVDFSRDLLKGRAIRDLKADRLFVDLQDELTALIHAGEEEMAA